MTSQGEPRVLFVTSHFNAPGWRKTGIHLMADSLAGRQWPVTIATVGQSLAKRLIDRRAARFASSMRCNSSAVEGLLAHELVHPASGRSRLISLMTSPSLWHYGRSLDAAFERVARRSSHIIIEAGYPLFYGNALRAAAPAAKVAALLNDDLAVVGFRPEVAAVANELFPKLDLVRTNARALLAKLPPGTRGVYIPPGIDKPSYSVGNVSPYRGSQKNVVCLGNMLFDGEAVATVARHRPDVNFHLIGIGGSYVSLLSRCRNVHCYNEMPFADTIPYVLHADAGLAPYRIVADISYLAQSSLKLLQYGYCGLPTVVPHEAAPTAPHVFAYDPRQPESAIRALDAALAAGRQPSDTSVLDWSDVTDRILAAMDQPPPRL